MSLRDTNTMYGMVSRLNHWIGALFVLLLLGIGLAFDLLPRGDLLRYFKRLHIAIGTIGIAFLLFRVYWRLHTASPLPLAQAPAMQRLASFVHRALLAGIVIMVVTGPLSIWSIGRPFGVFEMLKIPSPFPLFKSWHEPLEQIHGWTAYVMLGLIALHVGAVLKHQFIDRDGLLARMTGRVPK
ncbi:MAG: cytochrome b [Pseudomonadota bacterium]